MRTSSKNLILQLLCLCAASLMAAEGPPTADAILARYTDAIGGKAAWNKIESRSVKADIDFFGSPTEWKLLAKAPDKRRTEVELGPLGLIVDGFDGITAWSKNQSGSKNKAGEELSRAKKEGDFRREIRLKELYPGLVFQGKETFDGEEVYVLESRPSPESKDRFSFSRNTGLLVREQSESKNADGVEGAIETSHADYRDVDGLKYPYVNRTKISLGGQELFNFEFKVKTIEHNEKFEDAIFAPPAGTGPTSTGPEVVPATESKPAVKRPTAQRTTHLYATKAGQDLKLDLIADDSVPVKGKRPAMVFSFGGGWEGGSRSGDNKGFEPFTSLGYVVLAIDYRLGIKIAKERKEFTKDNGVAMYLRAIEWAVEDIFDATSFVLKHADEWNIDKDRIVLMGGSSGATDSLVAEFNVANETELAKAHLPDGFRYAGVISMAGAFWLKPNTPLTFKNKPAPIMFFHGAKDQLVTYDEIQGPFSGYGPVAYFRKFAGPDYPKWFVDYPQGDHIIAGMPIIDSMNEMKAFLQKLVIERQQLSIHTVEEGKIAKIFQNGAKLVATNAK